MSEHIKIAARLPRKRYRGDGSQRVFAFDFAVFRPEDIEIGIDGAVLAGGYSVALGASGSGAVTLDAAPADGAAIVVQRRLVIRRETDFQEGGELRAKTLNDELDFQTASLQQVATAVARSLHLPDEDADDAPTRIPRAALRAHRALVFDADGKPAVSEDVYVDQAASSAASAALANAAASVASASAGEALASAEAAAAAQALCAAHRSATAADALAAQSAASAVSIPWIHAASVVMADPGPGGLRFDAVSPAAATAIALSSVAAETGNPDISDLVAAWGASSNPTGKGTLVLRKRGTVATFAAFTVLGVVDNGAWLRVDVAPVASAGSWAAGDVAHAGFTRAGDKGIDGAGTIVSLAAADASLAIGGTPADRTIAVAANAITPAKLARLGTAGQVLTSNGAGSDASFQTLPPGVPAGVVVPFAGTVEPAGWLFAAGQAVGRAAYAALFAALGTTYGAGDGSTTFNLPDLRGRVAAGRDNMNGTAANRLTSGGSGIAATTLGAAGGSETHTLTAAQMPSHGHSYVSGGGGMTVAASFGGNDTTAGAPGSGSSTGAAGSGAAHPNAQPTLVLNHIVKT